MENIGNKSFDKDAIVYAKEAVSILRNDMKIEKVVLAKL